MGRFYLSRRDFHLIETHNPTDHDVPAEHIPSSMNTTINFSYRSRFALSFAIIVSLFALSIAPMTQAEAPDPKDLVHSQNIIVDGLTQAERAAKIDAFYRQWNLPLTGYGMAFVQAADTYNLDWKLLAAKGFIESTGGKFMIKGTYNPFGWGSGKIKFSSYEDAILKITEHLAGQNPATAKYYAGKTVDGIIDTYNPPSIRHDYKKLIKGTMSKISAMEIQTATVLAQS
jgi:hypothetical protein